MPTPPPCPKCGSTRQRLDPESYEPERIDPKLRPAEYLGFVTVCPDCGEQGMITTSTCKECGDRFEWIVKAIHSRNREVCSDVCRRALNRKHVRAHRKRMKGEDR